MRTPDSFSEAALSARPGISPTARLVNEMRLQPTQASLGLGCLCALLQRKLSAQDWSTLQRCFPEAGFLARRAVAATNRIMGNAPGVDSFLSLTLRFNSLHLRRDDIFRFGMMLARHVARSGERDLVRRLLQLLADARQFLSCAWYDSPTELYQLSSQAGFPHVETSLRTLKESIEDWPEPV